MRISLFAALFLALAGQTRATDLDFEVKDGKEAFTGTTRYYRAELSKVQPHVLSLMVNSLGQGELKPFALRPSPPPPAKTLAALATAGIEYRREGAAVTDPARWAIAFGERTIKLTSHWSQADPPEPLALDFDLKSCSATLLGRTNADGSVNLPAVLHLPNYGSVRITSTGGDGRLLYEAHRSGDPYAKISFPPATEKQPRLTYHWEVVALYPQLQSIAGDPRFDGFRRNWLNIFQVNPGLGVLANNSASDVCASCAYEYADMASHSPPLADGLHPLDLIRQLLEFYTSGKRGYGFPGWVPYDLDFGPAWPEVSKRHPVYLDAYPNLLIMASVYATGSGDKTWVKNNYPAVRDWAESLLKLDRDGNGLFEYAMSGNSGSWPPALDTRPANWWDTIGFGHEDAYSNALAYRGLRGMQKLAADLNQPDDVARYRQAADHLRDAYFKTFYNPRTGVLAGWKSADGQLHDYYFLFVNGLAIHYGLVPRDRANAIVDRLLAKMKEVGYTRFDLGLPGNLVPVARADYVDLNPRFGGGEKPDNSDGFQRYENGGATACHAFHFLAALYDLGRREEADRILFPMLEEFGRGGFHGVGANGMSNDWRAWDGTPWGYEGFLTDNYYALLAVLAREGTLKQ